MMDIYVLLAHKSLVLQVLLQGKIYVWLKDCLIFFLIYVPVKCTQFQILQLLVTE